MGTIDHRVEALERQRGGTGYKLVVHADGETEVQARERAGLADWPGVIIYMSEADAKL